MYDMVTVKGMLMMCFILESEHFMLFTNRESFFIAFCYDY